MTETKLGTAEIYRILADPDLVAELPPDNIEYLLNSAIASLEPPNPIVKIQSASPVVVVGDLHGHFDSLIKAFQAFQVQGADYCVFLGDYVDRGDLSVEVLSFLLVLRIRYGPNIVLLRGNHEDPDTFAEYGFKTELDVKGLAELQPLYEKFFERLPLGCVVNSSVFCVHGGIPSTLQRMDDLVKLDLPTLASTIMQMLWNDPLESPDLAGFDDNPRGDGIQVFGEQAFRSFMLANSFTKMIRAHEWQPEGFQWMFGGDLLSIFTAENYNEVPSSGSVAVVRGQEVEPFLLS